MTKNELLALASVQQKRILEYLAQHPYATNSEIGNALEIAKKTVDGHLLAIYKKVDGLASYPKQKRRDVIINTLREG